MNWNPVCDECAKGEEIKTIGCLWSPPRVCAVCGVALPVWKNGFVDANPMGNAQVERVKAKLNRS